MDEVFQPHGPVSTFLFDIILSLIQLDPIFLLPLGLPLIALSVLVFIFGNLGL